jgi:hypothetical protein
VRHRPLADVGKISFIAAMVAQKTDFGKTLEQLTGLRAGDPSDAPTELVEGILRSWKKPLNDLSNEEICDLVIQHDGYPFVLDLVFPKLETNPLFDGGHYPGDVLSVLIRADPEIWAERPQYKAALQSLYQRALHGSTDDVWGFRDSLGLPESGVQAN